MKSDPKIMFLIQSFQTGGAERLVLLLSDFLIGSKFQPIVCALEDGGPLRKAFIDAGVPCFSLGKSNGFKLQSAWKLRKFIYKNNISILHAHNLGPFIYGYLGTRFCRKLKFVYTEHVRLSQEVGEKSRLFRAAKFMSKSIDGFLSISRHISEYANKELSINEDKITTISNGVDLHKFRFNRKLVNNQNSYREKSLVIGSIAALREQKDHLTMIESMRYIVKIFPNIKLVIVGEGPLKKSLEDRVSNLQLCHNVEFLGHRTDISDLLHSFDLFVLSSLYEGLPLCLLEAMACGTPVVATDVYGNRELVEHNKTGFLVPARDPEAMANAVIELLSNPEKLELLNISGRQYVENNFNMENSLDRYFDYYSGILIKEK